MKCPSCGAENPDGSKFCNECGAQLTTPPATPSSGEQDQMSPKKKKGKGCLLGVGILVGLVVLIGIIASLNGTNDSTGGRQQPAATKPASSLPVIGDTITTTAWNITVNDAWVTKRIDLLDNPFLVATAGDGEVFLVVDLTLENRTKETQTYSSLIDQPKIKSAEGYEFSEDFEAQMCLSNPLQDGDVVPGMKKRGQIAFKVRDDITDVCFAIEFFGTTAMWKIADSLDNLQQ